MDRWIDEWIDKEVRMEKQMDGQSKQDRIDGVISRVLLGGSSNIIDAFSAKIAFSYWFGLFLLYRMVQQTDG